MDDNIVILYKYKNKVWTEVHRTCKHCLKVIAKKHRDTHSCESINTLSKGKQNK